MHKRFFTQAQINQLQLNPNVLSCTDKYITYTPEFKQIAVQKHLEEFFSAREIFLWAGFDLSIIGKNNPKECLNRWKETSGITHKKGRHSYPQSTSLEAQIAYLKEENAFLRLLRAKRAE
jgi:transposase